jgi:hypothetical protein
MIDIKRELPLLLRFGIGLLFKLGDSEIFG